jgi:hypothetical protein
VAGNFPRSLEAGCFGNEKGRNEQKKERKEEKKKRRKEEKKE